MKRKKQIPKHNHIGLSYEDRVRGYERDKADLLKNMANLSGIDFQDALCSIVKKWGF